MAQGTSERAMSLRRELYLLLAFDELQREVRQALFLDARKARAQRRAEILCELQLLQDLTIDAFREWSRAGTSFCGKASPSRQVLAGLALMQLAGTKSGWNMEALA